jgi:hypothetical protein
VRSPERQSLISPERLCLDSAVVSGKTVFALEKGRLGSGNPIVISVLNLF